MRDRSGGLSLLLLTADAEETARLRRLLPESIGSVRLARSAQEALPILEKGETELVIMAEPIPGDMDKTLLPTLLAEERMCLLLLTETAAPRPALTEAGVLVLPRSAPEAMLTQAVALLAATRQKLRKLESKAQRLEARVEDLRIINRAKLLLVQQLKMTETEAHRYIEKQAMDTCRKRRTIAESIIRTYEA